MRRFAVLIFSALWWTGFFGVLCQGADKSGTWTDPNTHLMWTTADNGSGLSWIQAQRYCRALTLAGFKDWTLPSIDELQGIVGSADSRATYRVKGPLKLTGWQWSSTPGKQEGEGWALDFGDGGRASVASGDSGLNRALCVRDPDRRKHGKNSANEGK